MKYEALVLDIDGTIAAHASSWQYIHESLGTWESRAKRYQDMFLSGKISYRRFCELDAAEWKGIPEGKIAGLFSRSSYAPNAFRILRELKGLGFKLAAVSTGLQYIPSRLKKEVGFDFMLYNRLLSENGILTGAVEINVNHDGKAEALSRALGALRVPAAKTICAGDSEGDIGLAENCGCFIAVNSSSEKLSALADGECLSGDFEELLREIILKSL